MRIAREEIFGPVLTAIPFEDEADALRIANDTPTDSPLTSGPPIPGGRCAWRMQ